jgi:hypothetical protein
MFLFACLYSYISFQSASQLSLLSTRFILLFKHYFIYRASDGMRECLLRIKGKIRTGVAVGCFEMLSHKRKKKHN